MKLVVVAKVRSKRRGLWGYKEKIAVNHRLEQVILIGETLYWEAVPQSSGSWEEFFRVEIPSC